MKRWSVYKEGKHLHEIMADRFLLHDNGSLLFVRGNMVVLAYALGAWDCVRKEVD